MDELLTRFARRYRVPAVAACVVPAEGPVDVHVIGVRRRGSQDAALVSDRWHIGSCTKTFTAVLWACLVERGQAQWNMPLVEALADLSGRMHPEWLEQTVDSVLWHHAGISPYLSPGLLLTPHGGRYGMAMGWRGIGSLPGVEYAMQGSNTMWSATALIDDQRRRAVLLACNDGRNRVLNSSVRLAASLLTDTP